MATLPQAILPLDTLSNRPAAGSEGRLFYATDTTTLYRDNGSTWDSIEGTLSGSGGAPDNATYVTTSANGTLSAEVLLSAVIGYGVAGSRPSAGTAGRLYYSTDTDTLERDNGSSWDAVTLDWGQVTSKPSTFAPTSHDHTAGDGSGILTNDLHDGYSEYAQIATPSSPASNSIRIYAKDKAGTATLYYKDEGGTEYELPTIVTGGGAGSGAPASADYVVETANGSLSAEVLTTTLIATGAHASRPAPTKAGRIYLPNDGYSGSRDTGSVHATWGPLFAFTPPPLVATWTWVNQGGATATDDGDGIVLVVPAGSGNNVRLLTKTAPATPWTVTAAILPAFLREDFLSFGLWFRQSSDGKLVGLRIGASSSVSAMPLIRVTKYTSATLFSASYIDTVPITTPAVWWLRISDNGTSRICQWSPDGRNWTVIHTVGRTDFLTADQYGFGGEAASASYGPQGTLLSLVVS